MDEERHLGSPNLPQEADPERHTDSTQTLSADRRRGVQSVLQTWGPFRLVELVGHGGFGEVYRAWDPSLEREVAVKLLLPGSGEQRDLKAILREARLLARVRHPNIVSVYGVDQHDGRVGFWSDFVRGQTLSELLESQGPFGAREVALIGIEVAKGIGAVHGAGLLHRDIKTGNVMREEGGRIVLMDFGLTHERDGEQLWGGTLECMAPELLSGKPASVGTDIYALGVLLFRLLTKKCPVDGGTLAELLAAHAAGKRRRLVDERPELPEQLVRIIEAAIDPDPAKRPGTVGQIIAGLSESLGVSSVSVPPTKPRSSRNRIVWIGMSLVAVAGVVFSLSPARQALTPIAQPSTTARGGAYADYLEGQELLDRYYKPDNLAKAVARFKEALAQDANFALAHAGLGRAYFQQYRDSHDAALIDAAQSECLAALAIDRNLASVHVTLGMLYTQTGRNDLAAQELNAALRLDATNAEVWGGFGELYPKQGRAAEVEGALQKAIDLAPHDWRWPYLLGSYYLSTGKADKAIEQLESANRLTPGNPRTYNNLGIAYRRQNKIAEARAAYEEAIRLEPTFSRVSNLGRLLQDQGQPEQALVMYRRAVGMNPSSYATWANIGSAYLRMPNAGANAREAYLKAISLAESFLTKRRNDAGVLSDLGCFYAAVGNAGKSIPSLRQASALAPDDPNVLYRVAEGYELLKRREDALRWISQAIRKGLPVQTVERNPELAGLRTDARFAQLMNRH